MSKFNECKLRLKTLPSQKPVLIELRLKSWKIEYNFK